MSHTTGRGSSRTLCRSGVLEIKCTGRWTAAAVLVQRRTLLRRTSLSLMKPGMWCPFYILVYYPKLVYYPTRVCFCWWSSVVQHKNVQIYAGYSERHNRRFIRTWIDYDPSGMSRTMKTTSNDGANQHVMDQTSKSSSSKSRRKVGIRVLLAFIAVLLLAEAP